MSREEFAKYVVGKHIVHVEQKAKQLGYVVRQAWINGEPTAKIMTYSDNRLNVAVSNGFVEKSLGWS